MGLIARIKAALTNRTLAQVSLVTERGNSYYMWNGKVFEGDIVRACIRPKVKQVGKLVAKHIRETVLDDGTRKLVTNPAFYIKILLEEPNPFMTGQLMQEKLATQLVLNNNAFAFIKRNADGLPMEIYPINATNVEAIFTDSGKLTLRFTLKNGKTYTFDYTDIIHLRSDFNDNDIFGSSLVPVLLPLLNVVTITDQGLINAIKNSSVVKWLLKFSNSIRPDDLKKQADDFAKNYLSTEQGVGVAAVDAKADAQQISPTDYVPNASVMDRTTKRIYALFNTNEHIVNSCASEEERNTYFDSEIEPVLIQLGDEYTRKLFSRRERSFGNRIVFEASAWDTTSFSTKLNLAQMVDRGALTPNEWRKAFNLAPVDGGDEPIRRLDTAVVGNTAEEGGSSG